MPEKYIRREGLPILLRHTGKTTLPEMPPLASKAANIVCLLDAGLQSSVFEGLLTALEAEGMHAIAFDLPGHGRSGSLDSLPSIEAMAELSKWVADWCGIQKAIVVGHGMGALIAIEWARKRPETVDALVLCGAGTALGTSDAAVEQMRNVTRGKAPRPFDPNRVCKESGPDMMRRAYMEGIKTDPRATLADLEASRTWARNFSAELAEQENGARKNGTIACPVRIISRSAEDESSRERVARLATELSGASAHVIENAAHFLPLENPDALAREIRACDRSPAATS